MKELSPQEERERELAQQVIDHIPDFFRQKTVLYIGANKFEFLFWRIFRHATTAFNTKTVPITALRQQMDVLEIDYDRAMELRNEHGKWLRRISVGDARDLFSNNELRKRYDLVFWAYGPSVLQAEEAWDTLHRIEMMAGTVVVMVPWGTYPYPEDVHPHPLDKHVTEFRPIDFLRRGYAVHTLGEVNSRRNNLLAWKVIIKELPTVIYEPEGGEQ
jgi:hypothetical protein